MPPLILSLALLLLLLLALLALSNQGLVALSFLGLRSLALPLAVWIGGAIALGFLLGIWLLLLLRLGQEKPRGQGPRWRGQNGRQMGYGVEDFTVVADGYGSEAYGNQTSGQPDYTERAYADQAYEDQAYEDRSYTWPRREVSPGYSDAAAARVDRDPGEDPYYDSQAYDSQAYDSQSYDSQAYESGYGRSDDRRGEQYSSSDRGAETVDRDRGYSTPAPASESRSKLASEGSRTATPADWDDEYREQWSEDELSPPESDLETLLIDRTPVPRLKRWFTRQVEEEGVPASTSAPQDYPAETYPQEAFKDSPRGDFSNDLSRDDVSNDDPAQRPSSVYDADYRLVQPSASADAAEDRRDGSRPAPQDRSPSAPTRPPAAPNRSNPSAKGDDWDIEHDLDW